MMEASGRTGKLLSKRNIIGLCFGVMILFVAAHKPVLNFLAGQLVYKDDIKPSDAIVVLMGDRTGERLMAGISLFKKGYGKKIVFWGGPVYWKINRSELCLRQLREYGIGPESVAWSNEKLSRNSSQDEAHVNINLLKVIGAKSFILVTSDYHTARARYIYAPLSGNNGMTMYVYPVQDSTVKLREWWDDRQSAKTIFMEFQKTLWYRLFE